MTIASTIEMVRRAAQGGYAVPAINIVDDLSLAAVIEAAEKADSPLIVQTSVKTVRFIGADALAASFAARAARAGVPVALHLDHCPDRGVISQVIAAGWSSVLFDASDRDLDTAWRETGEVVAQAHQAGVSVESEIENIVGVEDGVGSDEAHHAYSVARVVEVATSTGTDMIAPALGTAHGLYRSAPDLAPQRAAQFTAMTDIPLVLHGGTGLTQGQFAQFIAAGVGKINVSTALKQAYIGACQTYLTQVPDRHRWEPMALFAQIQAAVVDMATPFFSIFGSAGKGHG